METNILSKTELRKQAKEIRKTLDIKSISKAFVELIKNNIHYKNSKNIMIFYPKKYEINLLELTKDDKNFYLPKVKGDDLEVCPYIDETQLELSEFGVLEPATNQVDKNLLDLVVVPALLVDKNKFRLGYGKGFYDRFLKDFKGTTICVIPKELVVEKLPIDEFDLSVNQVIIM